MEMKAAVLDCRHHLVEIIVGIVRHKLQNHDRRLEQKPELVKGADLMGQAEAWNAEIDDACLSSELLREHQRIFFAVVDPLPESGGITEHDDVRPIVAVGNFRHRDPITVFVSMVDKAPGARQFVHNSRGFGQEMAVAFGVAVPRIKLRLWNNESDRELKKDQRYCNQAGFRHKYWAINSPAARCPSSFQCPDPSRSACCLPQKSV